MSLSAQTATGYCGTQQTEADLEWLRTFQSTYAPGEAERGGSTYYIPTKVHIVGTDDGTGYYNLNHLYTAFCELNERFAETGFIFYIFEDINYVDNTDYYEHNFLDGGEMMEDYNVNDVLNVYFVADPAGNCGYFSPGEDGVAVAKSCAMPNGTTITHEFGHFFSLPHTFYGWEWGEPDEEDQEWVNGDNCNSSADGFCDTPPDYLAYRWNCPGPEQTDPWGDEFYSDGTLYMSYSNDECTNRFSEEQMDAMRANLLGPRNDFLDHPDPAFSEITGTLALIEPEDLALELYYNNVTMSWDGVTGASEYHLQISFSPSFSAITLDAITTETTFTTTVLEADRKYFWRVRPLAPANTCSPVSTARSFTTGTLAWTDVLTTDIFSNLVVYPNPATSGNEITVQYSSNNTSGIAINLFDMTGRRLLSETGTVISGNSSFNVELPLVAAGDYVLCLQSGDAIERVVVHIAGE